MSTFINENKLCHTKDYDNDLDTEFYMKAAYSGAHANPNEVHFLDFFIENTIRLLKTKHNRLGNKKALEIGGGPNLWPSFLLAQYVDSIRFCDYAQSNLNAVQAWIDGNHNAFDWTNFFERILNANNTSKEKLFEWESRLRDALTLGGLSTCDVTDPNCSILNGKEDEYDIIFSSLCLEAACLTIESFAETIKRLVRLLKPGGLLLLLMVRNETFYLLNQKKFFCLPIDETKAEEALNQTNELVDIHIDSSDITFNDQKFSIGADFDGKMVIHAHKRMQ